MKIFGDIEDAAVEALMPLKKSKKIRTLDFYDGQLDQEELSAITLQFPAVYVVCGDLRNQENLRSSTTKNYCQHPGHRSHSGLSIRS